MAEHAGDLGNWYLEEEPKEAEQAVASRRLFMSNVAEQVEERMPPSMSFGQSNYSNTAAFRWHHAHGDVKDLYTSSMYTGIGTGIGMAVAVGHGGGGSLGMAMMHGDNAATSSDNRYPYYSHSPQTSFNMPPNDADGIHSAASPATYDASAAASSVGSPGAVSALSPSNETSRAARYNGRHLVPGIPAPAHQATTTLSPAPNNAGPRQSGGGPLSKLHVVPPRPKPGRKPATEEPESKRKAQNRLSQRNFRQRKQRTVEELQEKLAQREAEIRNLTNEKAREIDFMGQKMRELHSEAEHWRNQFIRLQQEVDEKHERASSTLSQLPRQDTPLRKSFDDTLDAGLPQQGSHDMDLGCGRCTKDHCACFAEMTNEAAYEGDTMTGILRGGHIESDDEKPIDPLELETDFTLAFRKPNPTEFSSTEDKPDCGFCAGEPDLCLCKGADSEFGNESTSLARVANGQSQEKKPDMAMTGPGSCADCQANPQQRAWCQRVAQLRSEATPPNSRRNSSKSNTLETMEPKVSTSMDIRHSTPPSAVSGRTVGCSEAFKLLDGRVDTEMDWRQLKPVPQTFSQQDARKDTFTMEPGMYSAMELDASSILTTLQHAQRPLRLRESDGTHARLVQEAEERRRASFSPMTKPNDQGMLEAVTKYSTIN